MAGQNLCYNCFQERDGLSGPCPYCGFDLTENEKKYPVALRAGTVLNDRYIVGRVLGQGGFGITYLAWDTQLEAKVAIKEFMPNEIATRIGTTVSVAVESRSEDFTYGAERFQEEARTLAKFIGNPNIAAVTSYFDENDTSYFVMDYIEGISFKTYIANHGGKVSVDDALNVMIPVLRALTAVHAEGFIHRDVTPDNIYITKDGMVKLLDFGSARYSIGDKSKSLDVILKVGYAPKEQYIRRSRQGPYTDVYSCAACFYAALTGFLPPEALERLDHDELVPVSQAGVDIPEYLDKAILKGLAVQPEDRFQNAQEFLDAIETQQVVEVPRAGTAQPAAPTKKKLNPIVIGGVAAAVAVVLGIGIAIGGSSGSSVGEAGGGNPIVEALAPTVTIGGEEYSTALTELDLSDRGLTNEDIQGLEKMTNLTQLSLDGNRDITDLSALSQLTNLKDLNISNTGAANLSPLAGLTNLTKLAIANPDISDLSPLSNLTNLTTLYLDDGSLTSSKILDLSPLASLVNMEQLYIPPSPNYTDFSPLSGMTKLREFLMVGTRRTGSNSIQSLSFLTNMTQLERIGIVVDGVDLSPIAGLTQLRDVELNGELYGENTSIFRKLVNMESLLLHASNETSFSAKDMSDFAGMKNLRRLEISIDELISLTGLEGLTKMESLTIYSHTDTKTETITTLEPLSGMTELRELTLWAGTTANVQSPSLDLSALGGLTSLEYVHLFPSTRIRDLSPVAHVSTVELD